MTYFDLNTLSVGAVLLTAIGVLMAVYLSYVQLRVSRYSEEKHRIELDRSRALFEKQIEKLHDQIYRDSGRWAELNHLVLDSIKQPEKAPGAADVRWGEGGSRFLQNMGLNPAGIQPQPRSVFVLTPLNDSQLDEYEAIASVCREADLTCRRGDEVRIQGSILPYIVDQIASSELVIANLNGRNPNVLYELGMAQALGKPILIVSENHGELPFDMRQQQIILYNDLTDLREKLLISLSRAAATFA